jgi:hypothetical protein
MKSFGKVRGPGKTPSIATGEYLTAALTATPSRNGSIWHLATIANSEARTSPPRDLLARPDAAGQIAGVTTAPVGP